MPCEDCPEHAAPDDPQGTSFIVYTGGPPHAVFASVAVAIPDDQPGIITKWSKPTVHPDGTIEYQKNETEPPKIEGYERDASNPRLLRPIWSNCNWRAFRVWRIDTGAIKIIACCLTPSSGLKAHEALTLAHCNNCRHQSN